MQGKQKKQKDFFIVTVPESKINQIAEIAKSLEKDGNKINKIYKMFGLINIQSNDSVNDLKEKYNTQGLKFEADGEKKVTRILQGPLFFNSLITGFAYSNSPLET